MKGIITVKSSSGETLMIKQLPHAFIAVKHIENATSALRKWFDSAPDRVVVSWKEITITIIRDEEETPKSTL